ncbi:MAG: hypothetical protein ACHQ0J_13475 [Candidatus Dormibacterales bacterium]
MVGGEEEPGVVLVIVGLERVIEVEFEVEIIDVAVELVVRRLGIRLAVSLRG